MFEFYQRAMNYFSGHVILGHTAHFAAGFGVALILQHYLRGDAFLNPIIGWLLVIFSVVVHIRACMS